MAGAKTSMTASKLVSIAVVRRRAGSENRGRLTESLRHVEAGAVQDPVAYSLVLPPRQISALESYRDGSLIGRRRSYGPGNREAGNDPAGYHLNEQEPI
jgi:hypothetical protein